MACTSPLSAFRKPDGGIVFGPGPLRIACGQCMGCRLERSRQWAVRCLHESKMHERNCFITLTYSDANLPENHNLQYSDFQKFMKRLRKEFSDIPIRFYMCGEYGETTGRPHYHACLFGVDFDDKVPLQRTGSDHMIYRSAVLDKLWPLGHASVGQLTFESAAYTARYITKKLLGAAAKDGYNMVNVESGEIFKRVPEFTKMSLKPGIGRFFYEKYESEIFPHDRVVVRGAVSKPPRYYSKIYKRSNPEDWERIVEQRASLCVGKEGTPARRAAKNICIHAKLKRLVRSSF